MMRVNDFPGPNNFDNDTIDRVSGENTANVTISAVRSLDTQYGYTCTVSVDGRVAGTRTGYLEILCMCMCSVGGGGTYMMGVTTCTCIPTVDNHTHTLAHIISSPVYEITEGPVDQMVLAGTTATLNCTAQNVPESDLPLQFDWSRINRDSLIERIVNGSNVTIAPTVDQLNNTYFSELVFSDIQPEYAGQYLCRPFVFRELFFEVDPQSANVTVLCKCVCVCVYVCVCVCVCVCVYVTHTCTCALPCIHTCTCMCLNLRQNEPTR